LRTGILIVFKEVKKIMKQVKRMMKYRIATIISQEWFKYGTLFLILIFNFSALINSGVLFSGGASFNQVEKYELVMNNYIMISSLYVGIMSICIGAGLIGADAKSKNIYVIFSAIRSRKKYYLISIIVGELIYLAIHSFISINCILILNAVSVKIIWNEFIYLYLGLLLNATVYYVVTAFFSVFIKGYKSILIGVCMYVYYYVYTFNIIPFVNGAIQLDLAKYKNCFGVLFPVTNLLIRSVTDVQLYEYFKLTPLGMNAQLFQCIYVIAFIALGIIAIDKQNY